PSLLVHSKRELLDRLEVIKKAKKGPKLVQIDVADGKFVDNTTWPTPGSMRALGIDIPFEAHLMVKNPGPLAIKWAAVGAKRVIFHIEAAKDPASIAAAIRKAGAKAMLALNPETL